MFMIKLRPLIVGHNCYLTNYMINLKYELIIRFVFNKRVDNK